MLTPPGLASPGRLATREKLEALGPCPCFFAICSGLC
jgi:hypothetical protein